MKAFRSFIVTAANGLSIDNQVKFPTAARIFVFHFPLLSKTILWSLEVEIRTKFI